MSDRCARITLLLALVPLVVGVWGVFLSAGLGDGHISSIAGTLIALVGAILIWRKYVRWSVLRSTSTFGLVLLMVVQVVLWQPLWAIGGCGMRDLLCFGQSLVMLGLGLAGAFVLWWGTTLKRGNWRIGTSAAGRLVMTRDAVRLAIGIALIPLLPGVFVIEMLALQAFTGGLWSEDVRAFAAYEVCIAVAIGVWWLLWLRAIQWNARRRIVTICLATILVVSPVLVIWQPVLTLGAFGDTWRIFCYLAPLFAWALWLAGTAWAWRTARPRLLHDFADAANAESLALCPTCGYSLRGLREVHCPECGWASTVDDIVERSLDRALAVP
jgi:hypothetical protein